MPVPDNNPYASPQIEESTEEIARRKIVAKLRGPSLGLILLSVIWIAPLLLAELSLVVVAAIDTQTGNVFIPDVEDLAPFLMSLPSMFVAYGAWCMRRSVHYRRAIAAAIAASLPFLSPGVFLGIPFGIWALVVLCRRDVRAAFDAPR